MTLKRRGANTSTVTEKILFVVIAVICLGTVADTLLCFQCASSTAGKACSDDLGGMVNTSRDRNEEEKGIYYKNCTDSKITWDRCMIESYQSGGVQSLYHRGCHDGVTFPKEFNISRFHNLKPNNFTTCAPIGTGLACYSFCITDFCNGPQVPPEEPDYCANYTYDSDLPKGVTCGASRLLPGHGAGVVDRLISAMVLLLILMLGVNVV